MENQWTARPWKVFQGVGISFLLIVVLAFIYGKFIHHPLRIWMADGECQIFSRWIKKSPLRLRVRSLTD